MTHPTQSVSISAIWSLKLVNIVEWLFTSLQDWQRSRQTEDVLAKLSDHELDDIGLSRGDLQHIRF